MAKKAKFYSELKSKGIHEENKLEYYRDHSLVIEGQAIVDAIKSEAASNGSYFDEEECNYFLKLFTKVNVLRKGRSDNGFDNAGFVFLSANRFAHRLAFDPKVKVKEKDTPFVTGLDFVTDKFWFKLKKGFNDKKALPKSFDIITKAQIVLSSQVHRSISKRFQDLSDKVESGHFTQEQALSAYREFREMSLNPEDVTSDIIEDTLAFLNNDSLEKHLNEKAILLQQVQEGKEAKKKLREIEFNSLRKKKNRIKSDARFFFGIGISVIFLIPFLLMWWLWNYLNSIKTDQDTPIGLYGFMLTVIIEIILLLKYFSFLKLKVKRLILRDYFKKLKAV